MTAIETYTSGSANRLLRFNANTSVDNCVPGDVVRSRLSETQMLGIVVHVSADRSSMAVLWSTHDPFKCEVMPLPRIFYVDYSFKGTCTHDTDDGMIKKEGGETSCSKTRAQSPFSSSSSSPFSGHGQSSTRGLLAPVKKVIEGMKSIMNGKKRK